MMSYKQYVVAWTAIVFILNIRRNKSMANMKSAYTFNNRFPNHSFPGSYKLLTISI